MSREFKVGDRVREGDWVRITIEGSADGALAGYHYGDHPEPRDYEFVSSKGDTLTVEKIEPPVKPGDFVQSKRVPKFTYLILNDGYVDLFNKVHVPGPRGHQFTSDKYTKIELTEAPF